MMKTFSLLGSTGSIGLQALEVMEMHSLYPVALTARRDVSNMENQARRFLPRLVCMAGEAAGRDLAVRLQDTPVTVRWGEESLLEAAAHPDADGVLNALVGIAGLRPSLAALGAGHALLLANKESMVCGGHLVTAAAGANKLPIWPVDSEHSAIAQCLEAGTQGVKRLILTASGGAFRGYSPEMLRGVTPEMALKHPNWNMGAKVTVDSATLLNKGLEVIEAMWLFGFGEDRISVVVHPQSIIHSLIEYEDGGMLAQLGTPDMRLPIQYALLGGRRAPCLSPPLDLTSVPALQFEKPDTDTFPCLELARQAARRGGNAGAVLNAAGETAVELFLSGAILFTDIPLCIELALSRTDFVSAPGLNDIFMSDAQARALVRELYPHNNKNEVFP